MTKTPNEIIESCLDVNASWREQWSEFGCALAFDLDLDLNADSTFIDFIMEECGVTEDVAVKAVMDHLRAEGYIWSEETIANNFDDAWEVIETYGAEPKDCFEDLKHPEIKKQLKDRLTQMGEWGD